jgi:microcystin-dependent protein
MSQPFLGQIIAFPYNFAPVGWMICDGQLLSISQYAALFSLLGTQFGGNGTTNFALPNLQGVVPVGVGQGAGLSNWPGGADGGTSTVSLSISEIPLHSHAFTTAAPGRGHTDVSTPSGDYPDRLGTGSCFQTAFAPNVQMAPTAIDVTGSGAAHNNMQPYLVLTYCIAVTGIFPARS